jgi:hypothetical protein
MRELGTGLLMLMVCGAVYLQTDPTIWNNLFQIMVRLTIDRHGELAFDRTPNLSRQHIVDCDAATAGFVIVSI